MATKPRIRQMPLIPVSEDFIIPDSSYLREWGQLPSPDEVRANAKAQHLAGNTVSDRNFFVTDQDGPQSRPPPAVFRDKNLLVKWGTGVNISEAHCLFAFGQFDDIPVPQVFGWCMDGGEAFIYMEYLQGQTLERAWDSIDGNHRISICHELRKVVDAIRQIKQDPLDPFIGTVSRNHPLYDRTFHVNYLSEAGPFASVREFHDWFTFLHLRRVPDPYLVSQEPFRSGLPDNSDIVFTHGDLHPSNIIITPTYHVCGIIDWEQSGWLPSYWEARKAQYTASWESEWSQVYLPLILDQFPATADAWEYFVMAICP
ncbi:uncharacterized protein N7500_003157 [Penicillium coprophilum]|uniref:uncharacterized protein n=1 Tax=Penicillium coprophilum TaxID=36646 RepID=UPI00239EC5B5|nr:uncharacterized protein N7500_003157 [Penicillium coprophilum]KAJ5170374.1 hypothetical protein N7500_003157 [Penicillium coprophilum]